MVDWLNACVAVERTVTVTFSVSFNRQKSKRAAKYVTLIVVLMTIVSSIHDPINRRLIDDKQEERHWCTVTYQDVPWLNWMNSSLNVFHFIVPFCINVISALTIIIITAKNRSTSQTRLTYLQHLKHQFHQHQHLLISPSILTILALPRLIISIVSGCMKSQRQIWLFFAGYFVSFIPPMTTFLIFVVPSKIYRNEFKAVLKYYYRHFLRE
ncbi:unnamed protein product [Didymodactylos carnosus]|uniref:G-protein coupled receptors family 1 profile domain-containing protein n=1 Tax=Didymodactylos carnosus TaxID=1234261 RepID=A0A8S2USV1_9BILA|nr:unnamed protein product [Didymodactylos carnosus]CAF4354450.1 unnamed protein product [Didymodactylos carnosus]